MSAINSNQVVPSIRLIKTIDEGNDSEPLISKWSQTGAETAIDGMSVCSTLKPYETSSARSVDMTSTANLRSKPSKARRPSFSGNTLNSNSATSNRRQSILLNNPPKLVLTENTYKTEPDIPFKARKTQIRKAVADILEKQLRNVTYNYEHCSEMTRRLSTLVKAKLKQLTPPRYKLICQTFIGQQGRQGLQITTRCLWSTSTDSYEFVNYSNDSLFATVAIHGVYYE